MTATRRDVLAGATLAAASAALAPAAARAAASGSRPADLPATAQPRLHAFDMADVDLGDGPFLHAQRLTEAYLLSLDPDRLLHAFRRNAGLEPRAPVYGGWESEPIWADINCHGHTLGHYLSACALAFRATGKAEYRQRIEHIAAELAACQQASGTGLVCAFPKGAGVFAAHLQGDNAVGVPWYTLHKVMAGLRDGALLAGSDSARGVLLRLADWAVIATRPLSDAQFEAMLATEHGGMNEVLADLYAMTGKADYRALAQRFSHKAILRPMAAGEDKLDGLHANTQVPKAIGFQRVYEVTGEPDYHAAAAFFWQTVVHNRSFATGGHGDNEHFFPMADFARHVFSAKGSETCCQYNMLKLTRALFAQDPQVAYADFTERTLYNGILASQDPDSGMATYFQGARPGYMKLYHTPEHSFWCCTGSGMENHVKYREAIYFHDSRALYVNLFTPSTLHWRAQGATLTQQTAFPEVPGTTLRWTLAKPARLALHLRQPGWSRTAVVRVNGAQVLRSATPGTYLVLDRLWHDGDVVELELAMELAVARHPAAPDIVAFTYGPLVLAGALGREGLAPGADIVVNERLIGSYNADLPYAPPRLGDDADAVLRKIVPTGRPLEFMLPTAQGEQLRLIPYHRIAHERYATYWPLGGGHAA